MSRNLLKGFKRIKGVNEKMESMVSQREIKKAFEQLLETPEMTQILKARLEVLYPDLTFAIKE